MTSTELRREIKKLVDRVPPERLESLVDYVQFLNRPELSTRLKEGEKAIAAGKGQSCARSAKTFEVVLSPEASEFYANAELPLARKLARCFGQLEREPRRHNNIKRLTGQFAGYLRYQVGDWRVVYQVIDKAKQVHVLSIAHRRDVYE